MQWKNAIYTVIMLYMRSVCDICSVGMWYSDNVNYAVIECGMQWLNVIYAVIECNVYIVIMWHMQSKNVIYIVIKCNAYSDNMMYAVIKCKYTVIMRNMQWWNVIYNDKCGICSENIIYAVTVGELCCDRMWYIQW